ncbi:MAG: hypothetical protein A2039_03870 [Candidatus Melainabacteria bacterium GWA2_34_9]|nr:MAG: hypothetical protein A2039_03870 [Candidatus Melainabacteria bacterium GWA2_34_9]
MNTKNIAIIGGGPAGFMAAIAAAETSSCKTHIDIFEKDIPLKTILYTGNGRCNLSNKIYDYKELASNYPRGEKFLYSAFSRFGVKETLDWFYQHGVKTYVQEDNRIFPTTDKASTVRDMLIERTQKLSINILAHTATKKIIKKDDKFVVQMENFTKIYDKVIIATGGSSRDLQSSGYELAKSFGHTITELKPSLTALRTKENFVGKLAGVSVKNAEISAFFNNKQVTKIKGDFVYTHKGISGPVIFKTSAYCAIIDYSKNNPLLLKINFLPDFDREIFEKELLEEFNSNPHKSLSNILKKYLPKSLIDALLEESKLDTDKKTSQITKEDRKKILKILTETELAVISPEPEGEIVTTGGVCLKEINPKTMESKLISGLYFCGEVMDIDGLTGGFNLQGCWSTGFIAGISDFLYAGDLLA